ncbi:hypothetical protein MVEN_00379800 [Mycena venus]|uniref:DUF7587 domain-containing protein n=1 Tax=Mycena venus TaxID=2733690 RepID=A0A8H6YPY1_9AGAR|nr:hypothetical protein MVEN_00379800 [Mycena venus]
MAITFHPITSDPSTIVPPDTFITNHTYQKIRTRRAQRYFWRVHRNTGPGSFIPGVGFLASACAGVLSDTRYYGDAAKLRKIAYNHIMQWKDRTWMQPTHFVSASYSLPYVLFEARRQELRDPTYQPHISIIDSRKLGGDAWLGTELVGAWFETAAFFTRRAEEVLVYKHIHPDAVVATIPLNNFFNYLPKWCGGGRFKDQIHGNNLWSTEAVAYEMRRLAEENNTVEAEDALVKKSVKQSVRELGHILPERMEDFDETTHADVVKTIAGFAAIFCWWPNWIMGSDPSAYPALRRRVHKKLLEELQTRKAEAIAWRAQNAALIASYQKRTGVIRTQGESPRANKPYARRYIEKEEDIH